MVAKITTGKDIYGALAYNQEKVNEGLGKVLGSNIILEPEDGLFSVAACAETFTMWLPSHHRTGKPVIHISLNPHPDDKLSDEQLTDIGREYMERMGYGAQPYLIFKHSDIEREHIHIVSLQVDSEGKKIKDSKRNERSVAITEELEKKYGLHPAKGQKRVEKWQFVPVDIEKGNIKEQIGSVIKPAAEMYRFQTMGEFRALLSLYDICIDEVKGTRSGKPYRGLVYSALDSEGNKTGTPIKSSVFGKAVGFDMLEKRMEKSAVQIKDRKSRERLRPLVAQAMNESRTETELRRKLKEKDIDLYIRRNDTGRITGVTFISHEDRCVLNGSRLGKEFSANVFNERFGEQQNTGADMHVDTIYETQNDRQPKPSSIGNHVNDAVSGLLSIFSPEPELYPDNQQSLPKKRKKKKRRYGRQM
jgi:hypothetical protein